MKQRLAWQEFSQVQDSIKNHAFRAQGLVFIQLPRCMACRNNYAKKYGWGSEYSCQWMHIWINTLQRWTWQKESKKKECMWNVIETIVTVPSRRDRTVWWSVKVLDIMIHSCFDCPTCISLGKATWISQWDNILFKKKKGDPLCLDPVKWAESFHVIFCVAEVPCCVLWEKNTRLSKPRWS